jgi:RimJ/RimL family protein N-acetyltransferase
MILNSALENNIWIILKNNEIIGYTCIDYVDKLLPSIKVGIIQSHQRRQLGTAIIALVIEIYAAREFPKNPHIYLPILQNIHTRDAMPTNKIALRLGFEIDNKLKMYSRVCKIISKKSEKSLLHTKMYIISEFHNDKELKIFEPYFIKKEGYSFAHIVFGKIQNNEFYLSNGVRYTVNFLNQGAEIKNCLKIKNSIIYKKYKLYEQLKELYTETNNIQFLNVAKRCKNMPLNYFNTYSKLIEYGKNNKFIFTNDKVNKFISYQIGTISEVIKSQEDFNAINEYDYMSQINDNVFKIDGATILFVSVISIYKSSGIVYAFLEDESIYINKNQNKNQITLIDEETCIRIPYEKFKSDKHIIDPHTLQENYYACTQLLLNNATLYPEQHSGFHKYGILYSLYIINGKIIPYVSEIFSIIKNELFNDINYINFIGKNIILPHFGIIKKSIPYMTNNSNDGALSKFYEHIIHMSITIDEKKNNLFYIYFNEKKIGYIELEIIDYEIEIKHIELDTTHRNKKLSAPAIAYLLEILGARYAPLNPIIFFKQLESIAEKLEFHKIKKDNYYIYKRLCRLKKFAL